MATTMALTSCKPKVNDSSIVINVPSQGWDYGKALQADISPSDSVATGQMAIALRHTNLYLYSNIWLEVTVTDSLTTTIDTLNITLADPSGRWLGRGIATDFQLSDTIPHQYTLHRPATAKVRHIMRDDMLKGVEQLGITFTQSLNDQHSDNDE